MKTSNESQLYFLNGYIVFDIPTFIVLFITDSMRMIQGYRRLNNQIVNLQHYYL